MEIHCRRPVALSAGVGLLLCLTLFRGCRLQNINSPPNVGSLLHMEAEMVDLCHYVLVEEQRLHRGHDVHGFAGMARFIEGVESISDAAVKKADVIADDILQIMILKRRLSRDWAPILDRIHQSEFVKRVPITKGKIESIQYLIRTQCDLKKTVIRDILNLQHTYKLPSERLSASGEVANDLETQDIAHLVTAANDLGDHQNALGWIKYGLKASNASMDARTKRFFLSLKAGTFLKMQMYKKAKRIYAYLAKKDPSSRAANSSLRYARSKMAEPAVAPPVANFTNKYNMQLCRGNVAPSILASQGRKLRCYDKVIEDLERPIHVEEVHHDPRIVILHDFLPPSECRHIRQTASDVLMANMISDRIYQPYISRLRVPKNQHWVQTFFSTLMNATFQGSNVRRNEIFDRVTLEVEGPGSSILPEVKQHWQMHRIEDTLPIGNFIMFMNDVTAGGGVAFPSLHLKIDPEEGSALFWQFKTQHGPVHPKLKRYIKCPVARGTQWVAKTEVQHHGLIRRLHF